MNYMDDEEKTNLHNRLEQLLKTFIDKNVSIKYDENLKVAFKTNDEDEEINQDDIYVHKKIKNKK